jgi:hypothetical protein
MSRGNWSGPRRRLVLLVIAAVLPACAVPTSTRIDDRVISSRPVQQPHGVGGYRAEVKLETPLLLAVRAVTELNCLHTDEQLVDRTVITTRTARPADLLTIFGFVSLGAGALGIYELATGQGGHSRVAAAGWTVAFLAVGGLIAGNYIGSRLRAGETREHVGELRTTVNERIETCGESPASAATVRLKGETSGEVALETTTDATGRARVDLRQVGPRVLAGWTYDGHGPPLIKHKIEVNGSMAGATSELSSFARDQLAAQVTIKGLMGTIDFMTQNARDDGMMPGLYRYEHPCTLSVEGGGADKVAGTSVVPAMFADGFSPFSVDLSKLRLGLLDDRQEITKESNVGRYTFYRLALRDDSGRGGEVAFERPTVGKRFTEGVVALARLCGVR